MPSPEEMEAARERDYRMYCHYAALFVDQLVIPPDGWMEGDQASFLFDILVDGMAARELTEEECRLLCATPNRGT